MHHLPDAFIAQTNKYMGCKCISDGHTMERKTCKYKPRYGIRCQGYVDMFNSPFVYWEAKEECKLRTVSVPFTRVSDVTQKRGIVKQEMYCK